MTGTIPSDLTKLTFLETLSLSNNMFYGTIPEFGRRRIVSLDFGNNLFTGVVPESICALEEQRLTFLRADCKEVECDCCTDCAKEKKEL